MRRCPCPCNRPVDPSSASKYFHPATCRPRYFRLQNSGLDKRGAKREWDKAAKKLARAQGRIKSDDRLSFERAVAVLADYFVSTWDSPTLRETEAEARDVLARARPRRDP